MTPVADLKAFSRELEQLVGTAHYKRHEPLGQYTTFQIGGPADFFVEARSVSTLVDSVAIARRYEIPFFLLGVGANILVGDAGYRGLVIRNCADKIEINVANSTVFAESGAIVYPDLINACVEHRLSGLEHFVGIPSTVGGALWQNLHFLSPPPERSRTVFIEEVLDEAEILREDGSRTTVGVDFFNFGYDYSTLHDTRDIVLSATFRLRPEEQSRLTEIMDANLEWRSTRHPPLDSEPSAGSIFKKIEGIGAGRLIDAAGLKGVSVGGAQITHRHANILINRGGAKATDVVALINHIREVVLEHSGYSLEPEISMVGEFLPVPSNVVIHRG
ncbi:MAG: UDP-N-acetylmuramate dehydrogenase [Rhodothermales bacterium]|nr:UDP-N-acetylmuramate dehydrogenase [Rhodothermales bacterium]